MELGSQPLRRRRDRPPPGRGRGGSQTGRSPRPHEPAAREGLRGARPRSAPHRVEERDHVVGRELLPDDGAALEDCSLPRAEPVEAGGEQRLDRLGQRALGEAALQPEREELLEKKRVALRRLDDAGSLVRLQDRPAETFEQGVRLLRGQRVEQDAVGVGPSVEERRPVFEELLASKADDCDRPFPWSARCSTSSRKVGSAQWTSSKTRTSGRPRATRFAELAEEPGELGRRRRRLGVERCEDRVALCALCRLPRASRSGQYVMPSPYERQRPQSVVTLFARRVSSAASRDLPTPGGPTTTRAPNRLVVNGRFSALRRAASSRLRPTSGASAGARTRVSGVSSARRNMRGSAPSVVLTSSSPSGSSRAA